MKNFNFFALSLILLLTTYSLNARAGDQKIEQTKCLEIIRYPDGGRINISVSSSRLSFHIDPRHKNYTAFKAILIDSCSPKTKKSISFSYDEKSQEITFLAYAGK